jgi:hypothetical protein
MRNADLTTARLLSRLSNPQSAIRNPHSAIQPHLFAIQSLMIGKDSRGKM